MLYFLLINFLLTGNSASANPAHQAADDFVKCIAKLHSKARSYGISEKTTSAVLTKAKFLSQIIELDRHQPEFTLRFADYFRPRINKARIMRGKALMTKYHQLLKEIQQKTGVPAQYLIAFWGLESNYGSYLGKIYVPDALATLACDQRRRTFFTNEFLSLLHIIDIGEIPADQMVGSWAGAMGHMQFMPSTYLQYARDGDGDSRRDLWNSIPDALTSAAFFLQQQGWKPNQPWGQEVKLPDLFDYTLAGRDQSLVLSEWSALGVIPVSGSFLLPVSQKASLLVPAGHKGPAFLVYKNFNVIMNWNRSEFYALTIGHLADRISGKKTLQNLPPTDGPKLTRKQVLQLQANLNKLGMNAGQVDGVFGPETRHALSRFQQHIQRIADGYPNDEILTLIREAAEKKQH